MKRKKLISMLMFLVFMVNVCTIKTEAYVLNGYVLSNPSNVKYKISSSVGQYSSTVSTYAKKWATYCDEINMVNVSSNENIYFYGELNVDNGTFAITSHKSNNYHSITLYKAFADASVSNRQETIVHEVGHALGLAHCESKNVGKSVMRATGFNGRAYPLSDDIKGISAIY